MSLFYRFQIETLLSVITYIHENSGTHKKLSYQINQQQKKIIKFETGVEPAGMIKKRLWFEFVVIVTINYYIDILS